jgi:hypothetical protein
MVEQRQSHKVVAKHVLRYLKGTDHYSLRYFGDDELVLHSFVDSGWARDVGGRKSTVTSPTTPGWATSHNLNFCSSESTKL